MKKTNIKMIFLFIILLALVFVISYYPKSISRFIYGKNGSTALGVAKFQPSLNGSASMSQTINLTNTITTNNYSNTYVVPGTTGDIVLVIDFSNVEVSTDYIISIGSTDLPTNLKLYSDSACTTLFTTINATHLLSDSSSVTHHIYWKWDYLTDSTSNTNDNLYMNHNLSVPILLSTTQKVGAN